MDLNEYEEILKFLQRKISENDETELQNLRKKSKGYKEKLGRLY